MPYIVYAHFETKCSDPMIASIISGSVHLDTADTVEEAIQKTEMYRQRGAQYPSSDNRRYGYYFWSHPL
jgi:hypothetical protein